MSYLKYGHRVWNTIPLWSIPATMLWAALEMLLNHFAVIQKLCDRFPVHTSLIRAGIRVLCCCASYAVVAAILIVIRNMTGINLFDIGS